MLTPNSALKITPPSDQMPLNPDAPFRHILPPAGPFGEPLYRV